MKWSRNIGLCVVLLSTFLVQTLVKADEGEGEFDDNIDLYEERFAHEHGLDNHDVHDDDRVDQGHVTDDEEDNHVPEYTRDEQHHDDVIDERAERESVINPELLEQIMDLKNKLNPPNAETSDTSNLKAQMAELVKEMTRLDKKDKSYRTSISSLLATTAELRIQIMKLNDTIKLLNDRDQEKDARITELEKLAEDATCNKYSADKESSSDKDRDVEG